MIYVHSMGRATRYSVLLGINTHNNIRRQAILFIVTPSDREMIPRNAANMRIQVMVGRF
jgi:hypothetical protein